MKRQKRKNHLLSVIVPAYREERTVVRDLRQIVSVLEQVRYNYEVIVVIDGIVDETFKKALRFSKSVDRVKVIGYETNKGKGYAIRFGMARSKGDIVAFIDTGLQLNPNGLSMCLEHFEWYRADIIVGSKRHPASKVKYPWQRRILSRGYQLLVLALFGLRIRDSQVGLKIFRRAVLEKVLPRLLVKRYAFDIEMLAVAHSLGFRRVFEAPVEIKLNFGDSSELTSRKFLDNVFSMFLDTMAVFYRLRILRYYADKNNRKWRFDPELNFRVNVG